VGVIAQLLIYLNIAYFVSGSFVARPSCGWNFKQITWLNIYVLIIFAAFSLKMGGIASYDRYRYLVLKHNTQKL